MGKTVRISFPSDGQGYFARECPACDGFFKVTPGTGLFDGVQSYCPYCGYHGAADTFWTTEQIEYAKSVILNRVSGQFPQVLSEQEVAAKVNAPADEGAARTTRGPSPVVLQITAAAQVPIVCPQCTLKYAVYGPHTCCPDCGTAAVS